VIGETEDAFVMMPVNHLTDLQDRESLPKLLRRIVSGGTTGGWFLVSEFRPRLPVGPFGAVLGARESRC